MAITSSGEIKFSDVASNQGTSNADIELKAKSEVFAASAATVGDRSALDAAPYALSEFYSAHFPNTYFDNPIAKVSTTAVTSNGFVDGETGRIYFDVNADQGGTTDYTAGLKLASNDSVVVSSTQGSANPLRDLSVADNTHYAEITAPARAAADDVYYPYVTTGTYVNAAGGNINHYDAIASVSIADPSDTTVAASSTEHEITHARSIGDDSSLSSYAWVFATAYAADDGGDPDPTTSVASLPTVTYTGPGTYTAGLTVYGSPSNARNYTAASAVTHTIEYTDSITANDQSAGRNEGTNIDCVATHLGIAAGIKIGYVEHGVSTTTFLASDTSDSTNSRFQASGLISKAVTPAALTTTTKSVKIRAEDKASASTYDLSNAFSLYPQVSGELASGDISVSVDPVIVGANTVL